MPYVLLGVLTLGAGLGAGLGLSEAPTARYGWISYTAPQSERMCTAKAFDDGVAVACNNSPHRCQLEVDKALRTDGPTLLRGREVTVSCSPEVTTTKQ